ncbi:helix-turn-helix domain-containing protein [Streptomyces sp. ME03-5684b]|uniref:helix-turn-helix domain-containing protein n=1 Tax=Streptomyces sp. ME03-5684b TaxID=3028681 RepID=UPI0029CA84B8|nr:helix-turn-helix domain-containing protein [Streptomyces sp. ME03-5684b]
MGAGLDRGRLRLHARARLGPEPVHRVALALRRSRGAHLLARGEEVPGHSLPTDQLHRATTVEGCAMFGMLSALAELQRELIVANTMDGLAAARARGRKGGRRPSLTEDQAALAQQLYDAREKTVQQIADLFGVPRSTVYGHLDPEKTVPRQPKSTAPTKP